MALVVVWCFGVGSILVLVSVFWCWLEYFGVGGVRWNGAALQMSGTGGPAVALVLAPQ